GFQRGPVPFPGSGQSPEFGQVAALPVEGLAQPGAGQRGGGQVVVAAAQLALQQVEGQAPGHGLVALAAYPRAGGDGFAQGQGEVVAAKTQAGSGGAP